ncbi:hypothetical protein [Geodermatophilus sp. URMC 63]
MDTVATLPRERLVEAGGWRTLETFWGPGGSAQGVFDRPTGANIKVRYGFGFLGFDRQSQTLDGVRVKTLDVGTIGSGARARMQMRVSQDVLVSYVLHLPGPG